MSHSLSQSHRSELNRRPLGVRSISPDANGRRDNDLAPRTAQFGPERNANGATETVREVSAPVLIAATLVKGGTDRWCHECGREIGVRKLRLTYRQGRSVFVAWVHPHVSEDEGQLPCAPDVPLVHSALGRGVDREKSKASTTDDGPATVRP